MTAGCTTLLTKSSRHRAGPRPVGAPGRLMIRRSLKPLFFTLFRPTTWMLKILKAPSQTADNIQRNSFACRNLSLLAAHFRFFYWHLSVPYRLAPRAAAQLTLTLVQPLPKQTSAMELTVTSQDLVTRGDVNCFSRNVNSPFFAVALRPNAGHGLLILDVSRSHTTTHHSR